MERMKRPTWISHRGYCHSHSENTIGSFDAAVDHNFSFLETDLRLTRDKHIVLCHDTSFARLGGPKTPVNQLSRKELEQVTLNFGDKVLFLDTFIERYKTCFWIFDIKPETGKETIYYLKLWLKEKNLSNWLIKKTWFLLWQKDQEKFLSQELKNPTILANSKKCWQAGLSILSFLPFLSGIKEKSFYSLPQKVAGISMFKKEWVKDYHKRGAKLIAYLPETNRLAKKALESGFDFILTNNLPDTNN